MRRSRPSTYLKIQIRPEVDWGTTLRRRLGGYRRSAWRTRGWADSHGHGTPTSREAATPSPRTPSSAKRLCVQRSLEAVWRCQFAPVFGFQVSTGVSTAVPGFDKSFLWNWLCLRCIGLRVRCQCPTVPALAGRHPQAKFSLQLCGVMGGGHRTRHGSQPRRAGQPAAGRPAAYRAAVLLLLSRSPARCGEPDYCPV